MTNQATPSGRAKASSTSRIPSPAVGGTRFAPTTTAVLTMALTGIAADFRAGGRFAVVRRLLAVGAMLGGAVAGAQLVLRVSTVAAIALVATLLAAALATSRAPARWHASP